MLLTITDLQMSHLRSSGVLLPGEELFIVPVSVFGTVGTAVDKLWRATAECWAKQGAASSVGMARVTIQRAWRLSLWKSLVVSLAARSRASTALLEGDTDVSSPRVRPG